MMNQKSKHTLQKGLIQGHMVIISMKQLRLQKEKNYKKALVGCNKQVKKKGHWQFCMAGRKMTLEEVTGMLN
jgi:hypothetical protein